MHKVGPWVEFPVTYRQEQVQTILNWVRAGESGVVVGMSGAGKSNLMGFLASRPDAVRPHLGETTGSMCFLLLDANRLSSLSETAFYRAMLQSLYKNRACFADYLRDELTGLYQDNISLHDAFLLLNAMHDMHRVFCYSAGRHLVWLLDRFDEVSRRLDAQFFNSLRALRDSFKGRLCYVVAARHPMSKLRDPAEIDEFYEIVAANTGWVGPMTERDARWVARQMAERLKTRFAEEDVARVIYLSGRLPAFLKVAFTLLSTRDLPPGEKASSWVERLLERPEIQRQCRELWNDLAQAERMSVLGVMAGAPPDTMQPDSLRYLQRLGLILAEEGNLRLFSPLFQAFIRNQGGRPERQIHLHPDTRTIWRGDAELPVKLTAKEYVLLSYFLDHVGELCTKDTLVGAVWPHEVVIEGVRDDRLAQLVRRLREKIELDPAEPRYIVTLHGQGYRFVQPEE
jgi:hypothetical protein